MTCGYAEAAVALAGTGKADDQARSDEIAGFLAAMPSAVLQRLALARDIMRSRQPESPARNRGGGADPERPSPDHGRERRFMAPPPFNALIDGLARVEQAINDLIS